MHTSSSEAMTNTDLSYLYGVVSELSYERNAYGELVCFRAGEAETDASFTSEHQYDSLGFELERLLSGGVSQSFAYETSGVWLIVRPAALRSSDAPATIAGAVPIGSSRSRMTATDLLSIATTPRESW